MAEITVRSELNAIVWKIEVAVGGAVAEGDNLIDPRIHEDGDPGGGAARRDREDHCWSAEGEQVAEGQPLAVLESGN